MQHQRGDLLHIVNRWSAIGPSDNVDAKFGGMNVSDAFEDGQRFRVLCIVDDCTREALATVVDRSLSGARMTRELDDLIHRRWLALHRAR